MARRDRGYRTAITVALIAVALGCDSHSAGTAGAATPTASRAGGLPRAALAGVQRTPIPIDDQQPGAEVSLARNFYFIVDGSGSMNDPGGGACSGEHKFGRKIEGAKWAVREFLKLVPNDINLGLYVFDRQGRRELVALAPNNPDPFMNAVQAITAGRRWPPPFALPPTAW